MAATTYIVGNWKMNLTIHEASLLLHRLDSDVKGHNDVETILAPPFLALQSMGLQSDHRKFKLAAQNLYWRDEGAFTGEISAHQLRGLVQYALIAHSERRHIFGEQGRDISHKMQAAIRNNIQPILCVGETALERSNSETNDVLHDQIVNGLSNLTSEDMAQVLIAYEPVWAIGSGNSAVPSDIKKAAQMIRAHIKHLFGEKAAQQTPLLYGGSVTPDNAGSFLVEREVQGLLVGGASLDVKQFAAIIEIAHNT